MRSPIIGFVLALLPVVALAADDPYGRGSSRFQVCQRAVDGQKQGLSIKVELKERLGKKIYEFDVRSPDGTDWDVECDADTGRVASVEQEVTSVAHPLFRQRQVISEAAARQTALARHAGDIVEIEYEIKPDGTGVYEFDIEVIAGSEFKLEIDNATGAIVEDARELWQYGHE